MPFQSLCRHLKDNHFKVPLVELESLDKVIHTENSVKIAQCMSDQDEHGDGNHDNHEADADAGPTGMVS